MKQLFKIEDLKDKVVKKVHIEYNYLYILFEDSFCVFNTEDTSTGYQHPVWKIVIEESELDFRVKYELGMITKEEMQQERIKEKREEERRNKEFEEKLREQTKQAELREYHRIKKKLGL